MMDMGSEDELMRTRYGSGDDPPRDGAGLYAIFLKKAVSLPDIDVGSSGLLYVGKSESSLEARNHFRYRNSSSSTLRRSLGAILKNENGLSLHAHPRGFKNCATKTDIANYRFDPNDEERLSIWMNNNLEFSYVLLKDEVGKYERQSIRKMHPPLNMTLWKNPQRKKLADLRKICRDEASECH